VGWVQESRFDPFVANSHQGLRERGASVEHVTTTASGGGATEECILLPREIQRTRRRPVSPCLPLPWESSGRRESRPPLPDPSGKPGSSGRHVSGRGRSLRARAQRSPRRDSGGARGASREGPATRCQSRVATASTSGRSKLTLSPNLRRNSAAVRSRNLYHSTSPRT
jgi:hypothetical protein